MHHLTYKNHFKFGYNNEWFRFRETPEDRWTISYGACERSVAPFKEECYATARLIRDTVNEPITVLFSGGADSEIVVRAFHDQHIPIKVAICQFSDNLNIHDVSFAVVCCEQLGIRYNLVPLDIRKFWSSEVMDYAERTKCRSPELCSTMWLADQVDGVPVLGSGEPYIVKRVPLLYIDGESPYDRTPWDLYEKELIAAWYRHFMVPGQERQAVPGFFQYTPEIMLSFMQDSIVLDLVNDRIKGKRSTTTSKLQIYQKYFPLADREKYTGFEKLVAENISLRAELQAKYPDSAATFMTEYNDSIGILSGKIKGSTGLLHSEIYHTNPVGPSQTAASTPYETRILIPEDYEQVINLLESRFATVVEFDRAYRRNLITKRQDFEAFRTIVLDKWRPVILDNYLQGKTHKMFGSFKDGQLMSMVGLRHVFDNSWVLSNLKAQNVPLSKTGLRETLRMLYQHAKDLGLSDYYCSIAEYRLNNFHAFMRRLVPEYYNEYEEEILEVVPAGSEASKDFWWGMMGRIPSEVNVVIKRMKLKT